MTSAVDVTPRAVPASGAAASVAVARASSFPYDYWHDRYQAYYAAGIRDAVQASGGRYEISTPSRSPGLLRMLRRVRHSWRLQAMMNFGGKHSLGKAVDCVGSNLSRTTDTPAKVFHPLVGQYVFELANGDQRKVCIDAQDGGDLGSAELVAWSDVYLKTNYWPSKGYPEHVRPFFNCNPLLMGKLAHLRDLRQREAKYDLCFFVRVWGGTDEVEGIEHILRLLEAANRVDCRKFLLAYLVAGDIPRIRARLEGQGIRCCTKPMPLEELWELTAASRLNLVRLGMHACVPWRMADLLSLGACPVLDQQPVTAWPDPLTEGVHYLNLGTATQLERPKANDDEYERIPERLAAFLSDANMVGNVRRANAEFFDRNLTPLAIGERICRTATAAAR